MAMRTDISFAGSAGLRRATRITVHHDQTNWRYMCREPPKNNEKRFFVEQQHAGNTANGMLNTFESTQAERNEVNNDTALSRCMLNDRRIPRDCICDRTRHCHYFKKKIAPCGSPCGFCTLQHSHKRKLKRPRSTTPQTKNHHNNTEIPQTWPLNKLVDYVSGTTITAASSWHRRTCGENIRRINSWTRLAHKQFSKQNTWNTKRCNRRTDHTLGA